MFVQILLDGTVFHHNNWGTGIKDWAGFSHLKYEVRYALVAGFAKELFVRILLDGAMFHHDDWGTVIENWAGAYDRCVHGWPRAKRDWSLGHDIVVDVWLGA